jgi:predicted nucleotidyltransferase
MPNDLNADFQDFIDSLTSRGVEFLLVGAHALAFHGVARYTEDLDVWVRRTRENASRVQAALRDFGIALSGEEAVQLLEERKMLRLGHPPHRIEILNFLDGCHYETAAERAVEERIGNTQVKVLGIIDYVATKRASGRPKDLSDLVLLKEALGYLPGE